MYQVCLDEDLFFVGYRYWKHYHGKLPIFDQNLYHSPSSETMIPSMSTIYGQSHTPISPLSSYPSLNPLDSIQSTPVDQSFSYSGEMVSDQSIVKLTKHLQEDLKTANHNMRALEDHLKDL
jgi:hypothetical protein